MLIKNNNFNDKCKTAIEIELLNLICQKVYNFSQYIIMDVLDNMYYEDENEAEDDFVQFAVLI